MLTRQRSGRFVDLEKQPYYLALKLDLGVQGSHARPEWKQILEEFARRNQLRSPDMLFALDLKLTRLRQSRVFTEALETVNNLTGWNPLNCPIGKVSSVDELFSYDELHPPRPTFQQAGFLRRIDRIRVAGDPNLARGALADVARET
jgi:hypothetical protein